MIWNAWLPLHQATAWALFETQSSLRRWFSQLHWFTFPTAYISCTVSTTLAAKRNLLQVDLCSSEIKIFINFSWLPAQCPQQNLRTNWSPSTLHKTLYLHQVQEAFIWQPKNSMVQSGRFLCLFSCHCLQTWIIFWMLES